MTKSVMVFLNQLRLQALRHQELKPVASNIVLDPFVKLSAQDQWSGPEPASPAGFQYCAVEDCCWHQHWLWLAIQELETWWLEALLSSCAWPMVLWYHQAIQQESHRLHQNHLWKCLEQSMSLHSTHVRWLTHRQFHFHSHYVLVALAHPRKPISIAIASAEHCTWLWSWRMPCQRPIFAH